MKLKTNGVNILYGYFYPEAKENFVPSSDQSQFDTIQKLQQDRVSSKKYGNPCELYQTSLDGSFSPIPDDVQDTGIVFWSNSISNEKGFFDNPISISFSSTKKMSTPSITLNFGDYNNVYATHILAVWMSDNEIISEKEFFPDGSSFALEHEVKDYNYFELIFYSINAPNQRLRLQSINFGSWVVFGSEKIKNVNVLQGYSPISENIEISTIDFTFEFNEHDIFDFSRKQPIVTRLNNDIIMETYISDIKRKSENVWQIKSEDAIGILDGVNYKGGMYENAVAVDIIEDIFKTAKLPVVISAELRSEMETVSGRIPYGSCRNALMQVLFAIGACVLTSGNSFGYTEIRRNSDLISQKIPLSRIMIGQTIDDEDVVTGVSITSHNFIKVYDQETEIYNFQNSSDKINDEIFIVFNEPIHSWSITGGRMIEFNNNFAKFIVLRNDCVLKGHKYKHIVSRKTKNKSSIRLGDLENVINIADATLISGSNIDKVLDICYNYFTNNKSISMKIVEGKHVEHSDPIKYGEKKYNTFTYGFQKSTTYDKRVKLGDLIDTETKFLGDVSGRIIRQSYKLSNGVIVKDCIVR